MKLVISYLVACYKFVSERKKTALYGDICSLPVRV